MSDSKHPLVKEREERSKALIDPKSAYWRFADTAENRLPDEPYDYEDKSKYEAEVHTYFDTHTKYYAKFAHKASLSNYGSFTDIIDESIETKFPRDQGLRAFISAYAKIVKENQRIQIIKKRLIQILAQFFIFLLPLAFFFFPDCFVDNTVNIAGLSIGVGIAVLACNWILRVTVQRLVDNFNSDARFLSARIQNRLNALVQIYASSLKKVHDEEFSREGGANPEWPGRSKWWTQLALWLALRVDHIEKFLQLEMQRLRVFLMVTNALGNLSSWFITLVIAAIVFLTVNPIGSMLDARLISPVSVSFLIAVIVAALIGHTTTLQKFSIEFSNLNRTIGETDWPSFAEMNLEEDIGELVRVDKENIRVEKLRGGGLGTHQSGPTAA